MSPVPKGEAGLRPEGFAVDFLPEDFLVLDALSVVAFLVAAVAAPAVLDAGLAAVRFVGAFCADLLAVVFFEDALV
ncbi:MAG: hypothetical protein ACE5KX_03375 [Acidimicrobiia bacterium]